jgi:hypothetical protein
LEDKSAILGAQPWLGSLRPKSSPSVRRAARATITLASVKARGPAPAATGNRPREHVDVVGGDLTVSDARTPTPRQQPQARRVRGLTGNAASRDFLAAHIFDFAREARAVQGAAAFACPLWAACCQEAGHALVMASLDLMPTRLRVRRRGGDWLGMTDADGPWEVSPTDPPTADLDRAAITIAGVTAEVVFDSKNFRVGSSIDEIALFQGITATAGGNLRALRPPDDGPLMPDDFYQIINLDGDVDRQLAEVAARDAVRRKMLAARFRREP